MQVSKLERQVRSSLWGQNVYLELPGTSNSFYSPRSLLHHSDVMIRHEVNGIRDIVNDEHFNALLVKTKAPSEEVILKILRKAAKKKGLDLELIDMFRAFQI